MDLDNDKLKFLIYDAKQTKKIRELWKGKTDKEIAELMKVIDEDHILIKEEKSEYKTPRIGEEYQAYVSDYKDSDGYTSDVSGYDGSVSSNSNYDDDEDAKLNIKSITKKNRNT